MPWYRRRLSHGSCCVEQWKGRKEEEQSPAAFEWMQEDDEGQEIAPQADDHKERCERRGFGEGHMRNKIMERMETEKKRAPASNMTKNMMTIHWYGLRGESLAT